MKKIFTLAIGLALTGVMFAADRKPIVTVTSAKKYEIVIDGRQYFSDGNTISLSNLFSGQHNIKVFKTGRAFEANSRLLASTSFQLKNADMQINISRLGQIQVSESRSGHDWNKHGKARDYGYGKEHDRKS